jgi:hypothetical protein
MNKSMGRVAGHCGLGVYRDVTPPHHLVYHLATIDHFFVRNKSDRVNQTAIIYAWLFGTSHSLPSQSYGWLSGYALCLNGANSIAFTRDKEEVLVALIQDVAEMFSLFYSRGTGVPVV